MLACPVKYPFAAYGREGTISCDGNGVNTLSLAFGSLSLPAGGLSVSGKVYAQAVALTAGQSISW